MNPTITNLLEVWKQRPARVEPDDDTHLLYVFGRLLPALVAAMPEIEGKEELHTMQLAAIMTASLQNTEKTIKDRIDKGHPYWTQAYADVCVAIDREMKAIDGAVPYRQPVLDIVTMIKNAEKNLSTIPGRTDAPNNDQLSGSGPQPSIHIRKESLNTADSGAECGQISDSGDTSASSTETPDAAPVTVADKRRAALARARAAKKSKRASAPPAPHQETDAS